MGLISDVAFTDSVKALQQRFGSRVSYARMEAKGGFRQSITADLIEFIQERDSFYIATANKSGQPYIQHRGGPREFLKILEGRTLGFADFAGNKQFITAGNLADNDQMFIFLMDYANRRRIKVWGRAKIVDDDPALLAQFADPSYDARVERVIVITVTAWDINCPQHIVPRYSDDEIASTLNQLRERISQLERENSDLKAQQV